MNEERKPPIGVKPRKIHDEERLEILADAIKRYIEDGREIPTEWIEEYNELARNLGKDIERKRNRAEEPKWLPKGIVIDCHPEVKKACERKDSCSGWHFIRGSKCDERNKAVLFEKNGNMYEYFCWVMENADRC